MEFAAQIVAWLNTVASFLALRLLAPIRILPGWLSATLVAAVTGVLLLIVFKYTSAQRAIKRVRDIISANLLALKLYKDSAPVTVRAQGCLLLGAGRLLVLSLVPMAVMGVPVTLLLGQLSLWYQQRPLRVGEEAVVTVTLNDDGDTPFPEVRLRPTDAVRTTSGPARVFSKREVCWNIEARQIGYHRLTFQVGSKEVDKELAVGDGFMRVSARRPQRVLSNDLVYYPAEQAFGTDSPVRSIDISYPERSSWTSGTDWWMLYWLVVSFVVAFLSRHVLRVNI
jgi:hypothetical protein